MKTLLVLALVLLSGCKTVGNYVVVGSASLETDRPDGSKAVAKVEVRYTPTVDGKKPHVAEPDPAPVPAGAGKKEAEHPAEAGKKAERPAEGD